MCVCVCACVAKVMACASENGTVKIWDYFSAACLSEFQGHSRDFNQPVFAAVFHPSTPTILASASEDETVKVWQWVRRVWAASHSAVPTAEPTFSVLGDGSSSQTCSSIQRP